MIGMHQVSVKAIKHVTSVDPTRSMQTGAVRLSKASSEVRTMV